MEHFSHEHPLLLSDHQEQQKDDGGEEISCSGCCLPLSSSGGGDPTYYNCIQCKYFLHKSCAELPHKIIHFEHPRHPLTLLASASESYKCGECSEHPRHPLTLLASALESYKCGECGEKILGFIYRCSLCNFCLDIKCASLLDIVQAEGHEHSFKLLKPMNVSRWTTQYHICDACGQKIKGMFYLCTTCQFWAHECCINTKTIKLIVHPHQLDLSDYVPDNKVCYICDFQRYVLPDNKVCYICNFQIEKTFLFYSCSICTYTAHLMCALSEDLIDDAFVLKDENKEPIIPLDLIPNNHNETNNIDDSTSITQDFSTIVKLEENQIAAAELEHFTHPHVLVLGENDMDCDKKYCEGCSWPIFDLPFYTCSPCNSHLHKACAELPRKISHLLHRHPLTLCFDEPNEVNIHRTFKCNGCETICNGFAYSCDICNFSIDVRCSLLTATTLKHEAHMHALRFLRLESGKYIMCYGCFETRSTVSFRCELNCHDQLDLRCATLPYTTKHRCPKHNWEFYPFPLTFGSEEGDTYYCDVCEEKRYWREWLYYCEDCDYSAHPSCVLSNCPDKSKRF